jgi:hypothetical protein
MGAGEIEIESITPIGFPDITPALARESGFTGVLDLLKIAQHGKGSNIYLIRFHYIPPRPRASELVKRQLRRFSGVCDEKRAVFFAGFVGKRMVFA